MNFRIWSRFPEDLFMNVMAFLPIPSLFRLRSVCKTWNTIVSDPEFHKLYVASTPENEFIRGVQQCPRFVCSKLLCSGDGVLLIRDDKENTHIVQPSTMFVRKVPSLDADGGGGGGGDERVSSRTYVVNVLWDQETRSCSVFAASRLLPRLLPIKEIQQQRRIRASLLHRYDSSTNVWERCGNIIDRCNAVHQVVRHRGRYLIVVAAVGQPYRIMEFEKETLQWRIWPEGLPIPLGEWDAQPILFSDNGRLFLVAVKSLKGFDCSLWEHCEEKSEWSLNYRCRAPGIFGRDVGANVQPAFFPKPGKISDEGRNPLRVEWCPKSSASDFANMAIEEVNLNLSGTSSPHRSWWMQRLADKLVLLHSS